MATRRINLTRAPDVVSAIAVLDGGKQIALVQKSRRDGSPSQCLFFEEFIIDEFRIQLRLDWNDLNEYEDPRLDAEVFKGGKKYRRDQDKWHHTAKRLAGDEWCYEWEFRGFRLRFKVQTTVARQITGKASIVPAPPESPKIPEEAEAQAAYDEKFRKMMGIDKQR